MAPARQVLAALDKLEDVVTASIEDLNALLERVADLRRKIEAGQPLAEIIATSQRPLIIERLTHLLDRLGDASSALRRAEAQQLLGEGYSRTRIAETFGVSRQRATALLSPARHRTGARRRRSSTP
jgi:predicted RecB family endonuclease